MTIGERMKKARTDHKYTQDDIADLLGVSRSHVSNVENGNDMPSRTYIKLFAIKLNISESWIETGYGDITDSRAHYFSSQEIDEILDSSTGCIIKYVIIQRALCPSIDLDVLFQSIVYNENIIELFNYIFDKLFRDYPHDMLLSNDFPKHVLDILGNKSEYLEYHNRFAKYKTKALAYRAAHMKDVWRDAETIESQIVRRDASLTHSVGIGDYLHIEDRILSHRPYFDLDLDK